MKTPPSNDPEGTSLERKIDALLASKRFEASPDFVESTLVRIKADREGPERAGARLDELLASRPLTVSSDFTERTMSVIRRNDNADAVEEVILPDERRHVQRTLGLFPAFQSWTGWVAIAAAFTLIAIVAVTYSGRNANPYENPRSVAEQRQPKTASHSMLEPSGELEFDAVEIFLMADSLSDMDLFLDEVTVETLPFLAVSAQ